MKMSAFQYHLGRGWTQELDQIRVLDSENSAVFIFGSPELFDRSDIFLELKEALPKSIFVGCSSAGEIYQDGVYDQSLSVAVVRFERTKLRLASMDIAKMEDSFRVGKDLAEQLVGEKLRGLFVLSDGLMVNGSELIRGISLLGGESIITGGLAGDGSRFQKTWVLQDGKPKIGCVTGLSFYGDSIHIGHGSQGGWDIFGPERSVTKSQGNVLYELDGEPALALYKQYLGEKASGLPAAALLFPLQIRSHTGDQKKIVRTILSVDEKKQSMTFAGDVPQGSLAQLMRANFDRLIDGASGAAGMIPKKESECTLALAVSCVGRRLVLGERIDEEVEATLSRLPENTKQIGFYSYGELSPFVQGQACELHNQTMTLTTLTEDLES